MNSLIGLVGIRLPLKLAGSSTLVLPAHADFIHDADDRGCVFLITVRETKRVLFDLQILDQHALDFLASLLATLQLYYPLTSFSG
jgi:hypothetical protein